MLGNPALFELWEKFGLACKEIICKQNVAQYIH